MDLAPAPLCPPCEVISPSTASRDRVTKRRLCATHEVGFYWLIDPDARTLEVLQLRDGSWNELGVFGDEDIARIPPFEAVALHVSRLLLPPSAGGARPEEG